MRSVLALVLVFTLLAQPLLAQELHPVTHANPAITVHVDAAANRHPIDPRIYGASWASAAQIASLGLTLNRSNLPVPRGYGLPVGTWVRMPVFHATVVYSAGGLCSTASDLTRWAHLLATGHAMLPGSYAAMTTPATLANKTVVPYGLGHDVQKMLGRPAVSHGGIVNGFQAYLLYFPEPDIAVAVVTNAWPAPAGGDPKLLALAVAKAALDSL